MEKQEENKQGDGAEAKGEDDDYDDEMDDVGELSSTPATA